MTDQADVSDAVADLVAEAADDFRARLGRGENPDPDEYAARQPAVAGLLRRVLARLRPPPEAGEPDSTPRAGGRLGDYRLLREVGRGGMGVMFSPDQSGPTAPVSWA